MAVKNNIPSQRHDPVYETVTIVNADGTSFKTLFTAASSSDNSKELHAYSISITSDDTVNRDLLFAINDGTNDISVGAVTVPGPSGDTVIAPPVQAIANRAQPVFGGAMKDSSGNWIVSIHPGHSLKVKSLVAVTSTKTIRVTIRGYNFTRS